MFKVKSKIQKIFNIFGYKIEKNITSDFIFLAHILRDNNVSTVLDIGANEGQFSEMLINSGYNRQIISFEPLSTTHELLSSKAKNYGNWKVFERCAVGEECGYVEINVSHNTVSSSILNIEEKHINASPSAIYVRKERVRLASLEHIINTLELAVKDEKIFLKLDVQGFELNILKGAKSYLGCIWGVRLELSATPLYAGAPRFDEVINYMLLNNFTLIDLTPGLRDRNGKLLQFDGFFVRDTLQNRSLI